MRVKKGRGSKGKGAAELRRSLVLRFLSGCNDNEMIMFLKLAFKLYLPYFHDNTKIMIEEVMKSVDLNNLISLKSFRSSSNFLLLVIVTFGGLMGNEVLSFVLRVLICIGSLISGIRAHKSEIHTKYASGLRSVQNTCILAGTKFFSQFTDFPWISEDLDAFFSVFVWPGLEKLHMEGIHSPTALLKLLASWTRNPKYFNLLVKSNGDCDTPLSAVMELLAAPKIQPSVTRTILDMFEALLTTADSDKIALEKLEPKVLNHSKMLSEDLNYGSKILLPHVPAIIQHLQQKLVVRKRKGLSPRDLLILSHVCELVVDADTSECLLKLLFRAFLRKINGTEETVIHLVSTIYNLMKNVSDPFKYLKSIAPLFGTITVISARKMLCDMLTELVEKGNELNQDIVSENVHLLLDINAWDAKWVEQPDFSRRLEGFKSSYEMIEKEKLRLDFGLILVHNCFYFLKYEKDLALKDSSGYCLRKVSPYLCKQAMLNKTAHVPDAILNLIAAGIREESNENLHDESIALLGELVRESYDTHPSLYDLKELGNKDDPEVDFFNNIIHLQSHRRAKALMRFCSVAKLMLKPPRIRTLIHFVLPFVSSFLCSEKYAKKVNVVDAAIHSIGIVCKFLPWLHYETVLKYYLRKLHSVPAFQKQLVRVVVSILDGFHYDVSYAEEINKDGKLNSNKFSEERKDAQIVKKTFKESDKLKEKDDKENSESTPENLSEKGEEVVEEKDISNNDTNTKDDDDEDENIDTKLSLEEELEDAMDNVDDEKAEIESMHILPIQDEEPFILRRIKLSTTAATKIIQAIVRGLLPVLQQTISQQKISERVHKVNRKKTAAEQEEEDTMCIPVALAIVKLLQQLPSLYLDQHLPHVLLSVCNYLKSRMESVRRVAREMLQKIMASLGPSYLGILLNELIALLTKGFHIHVLIFTIHSVLSSMKLTFKPGDMDACVSQILKICKMDLFGQASEEKDIKKITGKVSEARGHKSYDTLKIAAQYVTEKCFIDLLLPFKEVLVVTNSFSLVARVSESLHRIVIGLHDNTFVSVESILIFIYGIASGSIDAFKMNSKQKTNCEDIKSMLVKRPDSFLIPQAPRTRYGAITAKPKISSDRNAYVLVEFSLKLLYILLKRGKATADGFVMYIDPLLPILQKSIDTQHVTLTTTTLNCFVNVFKMDLPNLRKNIDAISTSIFNLLHKYATNSQSQGEYQDMIIAAFKAMTVLVRDVKYHVISELQLKALLLYVENDMQIFSKQSTAFPLLKAILSRKLDVPEVYQVMNKVAELSIVSDHDNVRSQARLTFYNFFMNYPLGGRVNDYINFYVSQLNYELEPGRMSAFQIIHRMIATFPDNVLCKYSGVLFVAIGATLVNDDSPSCKKMAAKCLRTLISRNEKDRDKLFGFILVWLKDQKIVHRTLGAQICGFFVEVEMDSFLRHMKDLLPILQNQLSAKLNFMYAPGKSVRLVEDTNESEETKEEKIKLEDHCIFQVLRLIKKVCCLCPSFLTKSCWMSDVEGIGDVAQHLLGHPHEWIRLEAAAVLGHIFASLDINALVETVTSSSYIEGRYLFSETGGKLKSLILDFCAQLMPVNLGPQLIEQVIKNLAFLSRVLQAFPEDVELPEENGVKISLLWMIRRMRKIVNMEIVQTPSSYVLREAVFKWIGALIVDLNREKLQSIVTQVLAPLARELFNEEESNPDLLRLARGVTKIIKKKLGMEEYTKQLSKLQVHLATRRAVRKRQRAQEFIHNPEMAAKRKMRKHQKKKVVKKRKIDEWKGRVAPKIKRKFNNLSDFEQSIPNKKWIITEVPTVT